MKHSYLLAGISSGKLFNLLARHGFSLHPKYLIRLLFLLQGSLFSSLFNRVEKWRLGRRLKSYQMPVDPIFIVGHWRTGTTLLHQLMALDENLTTPSVFQVSTPGSFLISGSYYKPVMSKAMQPTRPMDNVKLGVDQPQEDEYALIKLSADSPLEKMIFPKGKSYFLIGEDFQARNNKRWTSALSFFVNRLSFAESKRVLLKNPFHSMRIPVLLEMYPKAKFIHIHRHPYEVIPSTIRMWNIVGNENSLKGKFPEPAFSEVAEVLGKVLTEVQSSWKSIAEENRVELSFDKLEKETIPTLEKIYQTLNLEFSRSFKSRVNVWLADHQSYKKNRYSLIPEEKEICRSKLEKHFIHYNYTV